MLKLMDHMGLVRDVAFAPDGTLHLASASHDSTVKIWHLKDDGNMFKTLKGQDFMYSCAWSPDAKKLVCVGRSRTVSLSRFSSIRETYGIHHSVWGRIHGCHRNQNHIFFLSLSALYGTWTRTKPSWNFMAISTAFRAASSHQMAAS